METIEYTNPTLDKSSWPAGEWDSEPDKKQWMDKMTGFPCLIVRNWSGALCGYVGVPSDHPYYEKEYDHCNVEVHGGLTFAAKCQESANECDGICHKANIGEDDVWWLGFDCHHLYDCSPRDLGRDDYMAWKEFTSTYRDFAYVTGEVAKLAMQLQAAA